MIARLTGVIEDAGLDGVLVDVNGVAYLVQISARARAALPIGARAGLLIEMQIREDHWGLFGFLDRAERDWFRHLLNVQGVGGKVALSILSVLSPDEIVRAVLAQDKVAFSRADGVGPKLAARLVTELKDRAAGYGLSAGAPASAAVIAAAPAGGAVASADAVSALVNLGYRRPDAMNAVAKAARQLGAEANAGELIRAGLKELAP